MKQDLTDCTFVIPTKIDCPDRQINLNIVVNYIKKYFDTNIIIVESDTESRVPDSDLYKKIFIQSDIFHRTRLLNIGFRSASTRVVSNYDTDVLFPVQAYRSAINTLEAENVMFAFPYDGSFYDLGPQKQQVAQTLSLDGVLQAKGKWMHNVSVGGALFAVKDRYESIGYENPQFVEWGFEDHERIARANIMGYSYTRVKNSTCWHLSHPRVQSSWYKGGNNQLELLKIKNMNKEQLGKYIESWKK